MHKKTMRHMPIACRPYERLANNGAAALSDAELLSILLRNGSRGTSALDLAHAVLALDVNQKGLSFLRDLTPEELQCCKGLGKVKAITIMAALEMGRRSMQKEPFWRQVKITGPEDAKHLFENEMGHLDREAVYVLLLDTRHRVLRLFLVAKGGLASAGLFPRELFREAIRANASSMILAHNHPSGDPKPSSEDIKTTRMIDEAARVVGIDLIDHIIVGQGACVSLKEIGAF